MQCFEKRQVQQNRTAAQPSQELPPKATLGEGGDARGQAQAPSRTFRALGLQAALSPRPRKEGERLRPGQGRTPGPSAHLPAPPPFLTQLAGRTPLYSAFPPPAPRASRREVPAQAAPPTPGPVAGRGARRSAPLRRAQPPPARPPGPAGPAAAARPGLTQTQRLSESR